MHLPEPMDLLLEELNNDDLEVRIDGIKHISMVAAILGPDPTRTKLLPLFGDLLQADEDEVLFHCAAELGRLRDYIGGPIHYEKLLDIVQTLCNESEPIVRDEAVKAIKLISENMNSTQIKNTLHPLVTNLSKISVWGKMSSIYLFEVVYPHLSKEEKESMKNKFLEMHNDETILIKLTLVKCIANFGLVVEKDVLLKELLPVLNAMSRDENVDIRIHSLNSIIILAGKLSKDENQRYLVVLLTEQYWNDHSYKVRMEFSRQFGRIYDAFGTDMAETKLLELVCKLIYDSEYEVKAATLKTMQGWVNKVTVERISGVIIGSLHHLSNDPSNDVKFHLSKLLGILSNYLGEAVTVEKLLPIVVDLINYCENNEVKIRVVKTLLEFVNISGYKAMNGGLVNMLSLLSKEKFWRVRQSVVKLAIKVGTKCGVKANVDFYEEFEKILLRGLSDNAFQVRRKAIEGIQQLHHYLGLDWVYNKVIPKLINIWETEDVSYLLRITVIYCLKSLFYILPPSMIEKNVFPILKKGISDLVPNVRIVAIRIIKFWMAGETGLRLGMGGSKNLNSEWDEDDSAKGSRFHKTESLERVRELEKERALEKDRERRNVKELLTEIFLPEIENIIGLKDLDIDVRY